jgi:hypothetical protein
MALAQDWRTTFTTTIQQTVYAQPLQRAFIEGKKIWTLHMTRAVVSACDSMGWEPAAVGYKGKTLPIVKSEYLSIDVTAFRPDQQKWSFPIAVFELENQQDDDYVAYNLWKLLCVRASLRVLYCYRPHGTSALELKQLLTDEVVGAMPVHERVELSGSTLVVVGSYSKQDTFPYGYFNWWKLDKNTGKFYSM